MRMSHDNPTSAGSPLASATAAPAEPDQVQAVTLAQRQAHTGAGSFSGVLPAPSIEAPEMVFLVLNQSPEFSGDTLRAPEDFGTHRPTGRQQRPATLTEQPAEGEGPASNAERASTRPAPHRPAPARDSDRGEFMPATGPPNARTLRTALQSMNPKRPATGQKAEA